MKRPKRIYKTKKGRKYYLIKGKRKYVKTKTKKKKKNIKTKNKKGNLTVIIKNIISKTKRRKTKRKKGKKPTLHIHPDIKAPLKGLPIHFPVLQKKIVQIDDIVRKNTKTKDDFTEKVAKKDKKIKEYREIIKKGPSFDESVYKKALRSLRRVLKERDSMHLMFLEASRGDKTSKDLLQKNIIEQRERIKKDKADVKAPKSRRNIPYSIRPNIKVKSNIDKKFREYISIHGLSPTESNYIDWTNKEGSKAIKESDEYFKSKAPLYYDYRPGYVVFSSAEEEIDTPTDSDMEIPSESELKGSGDEGLYNTQIMDISKHITKGGIPVVPSDKISSLLGLIKPGMKTFSAIINTNPSKSDGTGTDGFKVGHWRSIFLDNDGEYTSAEYYDPLVQGSIPSPLKSMMKKIATKMNPEDYFLYKENGLKRQSSNTSTCGYHALKFIDDRLNGVPWSTATGYDDFMKKNKPDDSVDGERDIQGKMKAYDKFI